MRALLMGAALALAPCTLLTVPVSAQEPAAADGRVVFPASASQGAMVIGKVPAGSRVESVETDVDDPAARAARLVARAYAATALAADAADSAASEE